MYCELCGGDRSMMDVRDVPFKNAGRTITVLAVSGLFCEDCDEILLDGYESERVSTALMPFFRSEVESIA